MNSRTLNIILFIVNIIAIVVLSWIVFRLFPYIEITKDDNYAKALNSFWEALCLGIVLNTMFYYLLVYIPEKWKKDKVRAINQDNLNAIARYMQIVFAFYMKKKEIKEFDKLFLTIDPEVFSGIQLADNEEVDFAVDFDNYHRNYKGSTEIGLIKSLLDEIHGQAQEILNRPLVIYEDLEVVELVSRILNNDFYKVIGVCSSFKGIARGNNSSYLQGLHKQYVELSKVARITPATINYNPNPSSVPFVYN